MIKSLPLIALCAMTAFFAPSCKKDKNPPPPNEVIETSPPILTPITREASHNVGGYYEALPSMYNKSDKKYPLLIFIHGSGQFGNGSTDLHNVMSEGGVPKYIEEGKFPPNFKVNNQNFSFVVLMPQLKSSPQPADLAGFVNFAKANYRIDTNRVYITGFSIGGRLVVDYAGEYAQVPAAIVPISGATTYNLTQKAKYIADKKLAIWSFHNAEDMAISAAESKNFVDTVNSFNPPIRARITLFPTNNSYLKHDAWNQANDPNYKENGMNMYEWMLQYKK